MKIKEFLLYTFFVGLGGCTTVKTSQEAAWLDEGQAMAEVLVFRGNEKSNRGVEAGVGSQNNYVVALKPQEYALLRIPVGEQDLKVGSGGSASHHIRVSLSKSELTGIQVKGNAAQAAAVLIPILVAAVPSFTAEQVGCLTDEQLKAYKKV